MKLSLGLCVVALAACICSGYDPGHEYHYSYESQITHEFDKKIHQHAGFFGKGEIILQVQGEIHADASVFVKITKGEVAVVNERADDDHKEHHYSSVSDAENDITKPFKINYKNNILHDVQFHKDDPRWSVNYKKALAARFQMNFNHANVVHDSHSHKNHSRHDNDHYYHVTEDGIQGECDVAYEVDDSEPNEIHVTKTINFHECRNLVYRVYENDNKMRCYDCDTEMHTPLQGSDISHYKMKGNRQSYVTEELSLEGRFAYIPYGRKADYIKTDTKIKMVLTGEQKIEQEIHLPGDAVTHNDLHYQFEDHEIKTADDLKKAHSNFPNSFDKPPLPTIYKAYDEILHVDDGKPYTEAFKNSPITFLFAKLVAMMTPLSYDELEHMLNDHVIKGVTDEKLLIERRRLFMDALILVGTGPAFMFVKHAIVDLDMKPKIATHYVAQLPLGIKEFSPVLIEEFYTLCENPKVHDHPNLRTTCYLALSRLLHNQCVKKRHTIHKKLPPVHSHACTTETADKYLDKMVKSHEGHEKNSLERITCIKTAGNFGTLKALDYLRHVIHDTHLHPYYRFSAISSLWTTAELHPKEVASLMLPIYFNTSERHEIRSAALGLFLSSDPQMHELTTIVERFEHEPNAYVLDYAVSTIKAVSEGHHPCFQHVTEMCKRVLSYFKETPKVYSRYDLRHPFSHWTDGYDWKYKIGGGTYTTFIPSNDSYVPQHISFFVEDYMGKSAISPLEIDYTGYGLDKLIDHFFPYAKRKGEDNVDEELQHINEKIHIENREHQPMIGDISVGLFSGETMFFHFSDEMFENAVAEGAEKLPDMLNELKDMSKFSVKWFQSGRSFKVVMPGPAGAPFLVNRQEIEFVHFRNNQFKLKVDPNFFTHQSGDAPPSISIKLDSHLVHERISSTGVGTISQVMHTAVGAGAIDRQYSSLPLKLKVVVEPTTPKVVIKYTPIIPHTRFLRNFLPYTAKHSLNNFESNALKDGTVLPYNHKPNELVQVDKDYFHDYLGYGINFKGTFAHKRTFDSWGSFWKFVAETNAKEKLYYLDVNPKATMFSYELALTPAKQDPTTEIDIVLTFDHFDYFTKNYKVYKPNFPTVQDGHENYIDSRGDRKAATGVVKAEKVSKGGKERKLVMELAYTYTLDNLYHKLDFSYDRAPYHSNEKDHFKICHSSSILFPHVDLKKVHDLQTVDMSPKIQIASDLHFGKNCENDKKITLRGELSRTEEHQHMQAELEKPESHDEHDNYDAVLYKRCKKDNEEGIHYSRNCRKYYYRALKLRHYSIDIQHENLNEKDKHCFADVEKLLQLPLILHMDVHENAAANDSSRIHIEADFSAKEDTVDIMVRKPKETIEFDEVPHPPWIQARSATPFFDFTNKIVKSSHYRYPYCSVESNHVRTFDDVKYEIPSIECYKVLAKDCSEKNIFAVLGKQVNNNINSKAVKIILPNMKLEAQPANNGITITLNGQPLTVTEAEPYLHYENVKGTDHLRLIVSFDGLLYRFKSMINYGVTVYYDGKAIVTYLSPYYKGKQCGICGDFNNNNVDEFLGPKNCVFENATDFVHSYVVGDKCHVAEPTVLCTPHPTYEI